MAVYYKLDNDNKICYYTNEQKEGYSTGKPDTYYPGMKYVIELYNDKFVVPSIARFLFAYGTNESFNDVDKGDTQYIGDTANMFAGCSNLKTIDLSGGVGHDANIVRSTSMFYGCSSLEYLDLTGGTLRADDTLDQMFAECTSLKYVLFPDFNLLRMTTCKYLFKNCTSLEKLLTKEGTNWKTQCPKLTEQGAVGMFYDCNSLPMHKPGYIGGNYANNTTPTGHFGVIGQPKKCTVYMKG